MKRFLAVLIFCSLSAMDNRDFKKGFTALSLRTKDAGLEFEADYIFEGSFNKQYSFVIKGYSFEIHDTKTHQLIYQATTHFPLISQDLTLLPRNILAHLDLKKEGKNPHFVTTFVNLKKREVIASLAGCKPRYLRKGLELEVTPADRVVFSYPALKAAMLPLIFGDKSLILPKHPHSLPDPIDPATNHLKLKN